MTAFHRRYASIIMPIANDLVRSGYLSPEDDKWYYTDRRQVARYELPIDWDIPAIVEVDRWANGEGAFRWILWPASADVPFKDASRSDRWPGDVWGWGYIDARIGFKLVEVGPYHCRRSRIERIDEIDPVMPDSRFTAAPSLLRH